jgi:excisionase family DNA binding protein
MDTILLTRTEAAAALNLSARSVDYLVAKGRLPSRKFGRRRLIPRDAIERLAKQGCGRITPTPERRDTC